MRFSAPTRIAVSLASLVLALLCCAQSLGLIPDPRPAVLDGRRSLCEAVAVQACLAAQREDLVALRTITTSLVERNPSIKSAAISKSSGQEIAVAGDHSIHWATKSPTAGQNVEVPIFKGDRRWGALQICFAPLTTSLLDLWAPRALWLGLGIAVISFLVSRFYLRRILQHLDPSSVIPDRVRSTLDTLAEGVLVLDKSQRIVLANKSFAGKVGCNSADLQGKRASEFPWFDPPNGEALPWKTAIDQCASRTGALLSLKTHADARRTFVVNATPILGADGKGRGALATFDDVTSIEEKNKQLEAMLEALRVSRDEVRRQNRELEVLANNDGLTGCLNRRALFIELDKRWQRVAATGQPLSCIMVDIDFFKSINDGYGHAMGDRVLQMVSNVLRSNVGPEQIVGRYGGEEFALLLPDTRLEQAGALAEKLRTRIETVRYADQQVTASLGVSSTEQQPREPADLLNLADQALYYSKSSGRNRVTTCPQIPPTWQSNDDGKLSKKRVAAATLDAPIPYHAVTALSAALSFRDPLTAEHSRRVADFALIIAHGLMPERECYLLEVAALLHDVGKLGVPEAILQKPGPLTDDEWTLMSAHDDIGVEILNAAFSSPELTAIVANYHAWFVGNDREPRLPSGNAIPLPARILAIADAYDAMVTSHVYRESRTPNDAIMELRRCAGRQFDPELVERFAGLLAAAPPQKRPISEATPATLRLGQQLERLTAALEAKDFDRLAQLAAQLAATAQVEGPSTVATLASQLEQAARDEPDLHALVALTTELLRLCESRQTTCLKALQTAGK
jgi:diguanylate cyclase (GGDEF)-like protein/putative nucleotidyltransferase with HDIG domain/PAS domain S-box-containing protein